MWLGNGDASQVNTTGLRFADVTIPTGAVVTAARLEVTPSATQWNRISFEVGADASPNSAPFSDVSGPSSRPLAGAVRHAPRTSSGSQYLGLAPATRSGRWSRPSCPNRAGRPATRCRSSFVESTTSGRASAPTPSRTARPGRARLVVTFSVAPSGPSLSINDVSVVEGNSGTSNADFTVSLSAQPAGDAGHRQLRHATAPRSAARRLHRHLRDAELHRHDDDADHHRAHRRRHRRRGHRDLLGDADRTRSAPRFVDGTGIGTINNDDAPTPTLSIGDASGGRGQRRHDDGAVFTVTLSAAARATRRSR